jgi:SpoIIAA-like
MTQADGDLYFNAPGTASVRWDGAGATVLVEWEGWANSAEFAAMLDAGVRALKDHKGSRWLADCRRQKVLSPADQDRADREWLPRALAGGLKQFAVVLPESGLAGMNLKDRLKEVPNTRLQVGYFATVEQAREWLAR